MLAGELALAGIDVAIVERRVDEDLSGARAGGLHSRTIEELDQRGIADRFLAQGRTAQIAGFAWIPLNMSGLPTRHPYGLALFQTHIERLLAEWIGELGVPVYRGREVTGFSQDDTGVDVTSSGGESLRAAYLVGCDGGRSLVRKAAGIDFPGWDATVSHIIAEVELADEPQWGLRRDELGIRALSRMENGPVRVMVTERRPGRTGEPSLDDGGVDPRQRQLAGEHHARRTASGDHHGVLGQSDHPVMFAKLTVDSRVVFRMSPSDVHGAALRRRIRRKPATLRCDPGLAASPRVRYNLIVAGGLPSTRSSEFGDEPLPGALGPIVARKQRVILPPPAPGTTPASARLQPALALERLEPLLPERAQPLQPALELGEPVGVELVDPLLRRDARADELRAAQHLEVLRHGGGADGEPAGDLAGGERSAGEHLDDAPAGGIGEGGEAEHAPEYPPTLFKSTLIYVHPSACSIAGMAHFGLQNAAIVAEKCKIDA